MVREYKSNWSIKERERERKKIRKTGKKKKGEKKRETFWKFFWSLIKKIKGKKKNVNQFKYSYKNECEEPSNKDRMQRNSGKS